MRLLLSVVLLAAGCGGSSVPSGDPEDCGSAGRCALMCSAQPAACFWAGVYFQNGRSGPDDLERSFQLLERGCSGGDLRSCRGVAVAYSRGLGVARDAARAETLFLKLADRAGDACKGDSALGCEVAASMFDWGRGVAADKKRAATLWVRAADLYEAQCKHGDGPACDRAAAALGALRSDTELVSKEQRDERRRGLERLACDKGVPMACKAVAVVLAGKSEGISAEAETLYERAERELQRRCDDNNINRCIQLYGLLESRSRTGGLPTLLRAVAVANKVCKLGAAWSCDRVASMLRRACSSRRQCTDQERRDLERQAFGAKIRVVAMQETRCRAGMMSGCEGLAHELMPSSGSGSSELRAPARELYDRLCSAGRSTACYRLASSYRYGGDYGERAKGLVYLEKGCALGDGFSCDRAAEAYREGKYVLRDEVRAQELSHKACRADSYFCKGRGKAALDKKRAP